jgi:hypothetical protein
VVQVPVGVKGEREAVERRLELPRLGALRDVEELVVGCLVEHRSPG